MTLSERLLECDIKAQAFFFRIMLLLQSGRPCGWLNLDVNELASLHGQSRTYCYEMLESLRAQGILARGIQGYYCPGIVAEFIGRCKK